MSRHSGLDMLTVLARQHREIQSMVDELGGMSPQARRQRHAATLTVARELLRHRDVERRCLHTAARKFLLNGRDLVGRDERQWTETQQVIRTLEDTEPGSGRLDQLIGRLAALFRGHVEEQEHALFVELNKHADRSDLEWLGDRAGAPGGAAPS